MIHQQTKKLVPQRIMEKNYIFNSPPSFVWESVGRFKSRNLTNQIPLSHQSWTMIPEQRKYDQGSRNKCGEFDALICYMILHTCLTGVNTVQKFTRLYFSYALFYIAFFYTEKFKTIMADIKNPAIQFSQKCAIPL